MINKDRTVLTECALKRLIVFASVVLVHGTMCVHWLRAQEPCRRAVVEAEKLYEYGRFLQARSILTSCLQEEAPGIHKLNAYRLLALSYLAEDRLPEATTAVLEIFVLKPDYAPNPVQDPLPYRDLVNRVRSRQPASLLEKVTGGWKKWVWGGCFVATAAILASTIFGKKQLDDPVALPNPPKLP